MNCPGKFHHLLRAAVCIVLHNVWKHRGICHAMSKVKMRAQRMRDAVYQSQVGIREPESGNDASQHHLLSCLHIRAVLYRPRQIFIENLQSF